MPTTKGFFSPQRLKTFWVYSLTQVFPHPIFLAAGLEAIIRGKGKREAKKSRVVGLGKTGHSKVWVWLILLCSFLFFQGEH